jgi:biotin-(acetyl-CoA carboxylase) ligase
MEQSATSLRELGMHPNLSELAAELCTAIRREILTWLGKQGRLDVLRIDERLAFRDAAIEYDLGPQQGRHEGLLRGLDVTGALRLATDAGDEIVQPLCITASRGQPPWQAS